jgi:hypothetical protein
MRNAAMAPNVQGECDERQREKQMEDDEHLGEIAGFARCNPHKSLAATAPETDNVGNENGLRIKGLRLARQPVKHSDAEKWSPRSRNRAMSCGDASGGTAPTPN